MQFQKVTDQNNSQIYIFFVANGLEYFFNYEQNMSVNITFECACPGADSFKPDGSRTVCFTLCIILLLVMVWGYTNIFNLQNVFCFIPLKH